MSADDLARQNIRQLLRYLIHDLKIPEAALWSLLYEAMVESRDNVVAKTLSVSQT